MKIVIGGIPIEVVTEDAGFRRILQTQYADFSAAPPGAQPAESQPPIRLAVEITTDSAPVNADPDDDLQVTRQNGVWNFTRGDFRATWDPAQRLAAVRQSANRHSIDSVIRIIHSLVLVSQGGFLLHAASAIRAGEAWLFAGRSGAGKTTLSRLAPPDACLLSDEVSFVRDSPQGYLAWGTPFTGELGKPGTNRCAPVAALCFLEQATTNRLTRLGRAEALQQLLTNILFFADDRGLVSRLFDVAARFIDGVEVFRLSFRPDASVWELIQ